MKKKKNKFAQPFEDREIQPVTNPLKLACAEHIRIVRERARLDDMPPKIAMIVHDELKEAFLKGAKYERDLNKIIEVGGHD